MAARSLGGARARPGQGARPPGAPAGAGGAPLPVAPAGAGGAPLPVAPAGATAAVPRPAAPAPRRRAARAAAALTLLALAAGCREAGPPAYLPLGGATVRAGGAALPAPPPAAWAMWGADPQHTGQGAGRGPASPAVLAAVPGVPVPGAAQVAVGADGTAYVAGLSPAGEGAGSGGPEAPSGGPGGPAPAALVAVAPGGAIRWRVPLVGHPHTPALGPGGAVYALAGGELVAVDATTGQRRWAVRLAAAPPEGAPEAAPVVAPGGTVYAAAGGGLAAVAPDGILRWRWPAQHLPWVGTPAVGPDGTLYVPAATGEGFALIALDPEGPRERWRLSLPARPSTPAVAGSVVRVAMATARGEAQVLAVRAKGTLRGSVTAPAWDGPDLLPALAGGAAHVGAVAVEGDKVRAPALPPGLAGASPAALDAVGHRYLLASGPTGHALVALDPQGRLLWQRPLQAPGSYPVVAGGRVYVVDGGRLVAYGDPER